MFLNSQPRSRGLSSLPPLVVQRKTLVAANHVTTQNLGGKKSVAVSHNIHVVDGSGAARLWPGASNMATRRSS